jgi:hypothetical protein
MSGNVSLTGMRVQGVVYLKTDFDGATPFERPYGARESGHPGVGGND